MNKSLVVSSFALALAASSQAIVITGGYIDLQTSGGTITSNNVGGFYGGGGPSGSVGFSVSGAYTTRMPRTDSFARTDLNVYVSFRTENIPVLVTSIDLLSNGKVVNGGGHSETPNTAVGTAGAIFEYEDANSDGLYEAGETQYYTPMIAGNAFHTFLDGNGYKTWEYGGTNGGYILAADTTYTLQLLNSDLISVSNLGGAPTVSVTHEIFNDTLSFNYEPVPEPASIAAIGLGLAAIGRRRRR